MFRAKKVLCYLAVGLLIISILTEEVEARRKVLIGRKIVNRHYYRGTAIPAWSIALLCGISMLILGGGSYFGLKKLLVDALDIQEGPRYYPAKSEEV